jgi:N6-adenosine-specific RNA methylase IME4
MTAAGICTLDGLVGLSGFRCIVADPPWAYATRMRGNMAKGEMRAVDFSEYPTMDTEAICGLPVRSVAADGAHLYLWTTQAFMRDAYRVLDAWGFKQGAVLVWSKPPKGVCGTYVCSAEFCLFARRGSLGHKRRNIGTVFEWPRGRHSAKPEAFQDMVETVSPGPYLELFARRPRLGWTVWGNEVEANRALCVKGKERQ